MLRDIPATVELPELPLGLTIDQAIDRNRPLVAFRGLPLEWSNDFGDGVVRHHPELLLVAVEQLLSNVIEHGGEQKQVYFHLFSEDDGVVWKCGTTDRESTKNSWNGPGKPWRTVIHWFASVYT